MSEDNTGRNSEMNKEKETVRLVFDERLFELLSKDLYKDTLSFLRELTQNSADAIRNRKIIQPDLKGKICWTFNEEEGTLIQTDNGMGMDYGFVKEDWKKVGKSFKDGDNIGMYGIGRLSLWQVAESICIRTNDVEIEWNSIPSYDITQKTEKQDGFVCKIKIRKDKHYVLDVEEITRYLEENINMEDITILVNDKEIIPERYEYSFLSQLETEKASVWFKKPDGYNDCMKIFEKGLLVKSNYSSKINCIIDFNRAVKTLSRESLTITDYEVLETIFKAMKKLAKENLGNKELRPIYFEEMKKLELTISYLASHFSDIELAELVPISDKLLGEYVGYYYSKHSVLVERAKEKGISVLVVDSQYDEACCELIGLKPLSDIKDKLARKFFVKKTDSEKGKRILKNCASYMEFLSKLTNDLQKSLSSKNRPNANIVKATNLKALEERYKKTAEGLDIELREEGCGDIKYTYGNLAFGENEREEVTAWQSGYYTVLNLLNDLVKTLIETERLDLIEETLIHEFTHLLGCHYHDEDFVSTYNTVLDETLKWKARNTAIFETTAQVNAIGEKYQQASTKIPKEAIVKLEIKKGQKIRVIVEKAEDSEEEANENLAKTEEEDKNHKEGLGSLFS